MKFYIVRYNYGYGDVYEVVEASHEEEADHEAYLLWLDAVKSNADYEVVGEWTQELEDLYM